MIKFEDIMKLKVGDTVVCCVTPPNLHTYTPGEEYIINVKNRDDVELRPLYNGHKLTELLSYENVSLDDLYKYFMLPNIDDFYIGDMAVLNYENDLHFVYVKQIIWTTVVPANGIEPYKFVTGDNVWCEMCANMHDISEIIDFGKVKKSNLVKIHYNIVNWKQIEITPGMNVLVDYNGHSVYEHIVQIIIPNGMTTRYITRNVIGEVFSRSIDDFKIPRNKFDPGHKIIAAKGNRFMITKISKFDGYAKEGYQYKYSVAALKTGSNEIRVIHNIPECKMNDLLYYLCITFRDEWGDTMDDPDEAQTQN